MDRQSRGTARNLNSDTGWGVHHNGRPSNGEDQTRNTKFVRVLGYDIRSYRSNTVLLHILCDDGTIIEHDVYGTVPSENDGWPSFLHDLGRWSKDIGATADRIREWLADPESETLARWEIIAYGDRPLDRYVLDASGPERAAIREMLDRIERIKE